MSSSLRHRLLATTLALASLWSGCGGTDGNGNGGTDPTPSISIRVAPGSLTLEQGEDGTITLTLTRSGGFTGGVSLAVEGLPTGVTASAASIPASSTQAQVTLSAADQAAVGAVTLTVRATGAGVDAATTTLSLTVDAMPVGTFQLSLNPATLSIEQGEGGSTTVGVDRSGGFTGTVNLSLSGAPSGLAAALASTVVDGAETTLQVDADGALAAGTYTLTVTGSGDGTSDATAELQVTVTDAPSGGPTQATWSFCAEVPVWFAVQDGPSGAWTRVPPAAGSGGSEFDLSVDSDRVAVAYVMDEGAGFTTLDVHYLGADELEVIGASFCEDAGPKTVNVSVQNLGFNEIASLALGGSLAQAFGPQPTATFQEVVEGTVDLFGARSQVDVGTGEQLVNRYYLERGLMPADGSTILVDFAGANSFDPVSATATIGNLGTEPASIAVGFKTPATVTYLGVASIGMISNDDTRDLLLVPAARQEAGDLHTIFVNAVDDADDPEFFRTGIDFFEGVQDPQIDLGPRLQGLSVTTGSMAPYARPRVQYPIQAEYARFWAAAFDQANRTVELLVTDGWESGAALDVTFPDLSGADGWDPAWALQVGLAVDVVFTALGWNAAGGTLAPIQVSDGLEITSAAWGGVINP